MEKTNSYADRFIQGWVWPLGTAVTLVAVFYYGTMFVRALFREFGPWLITLLEILFK